MARISSEKAVNQIGNRYDLVLIASARVREFNKGVRPKIKSQNSKSVTALQEIEEGLIGREYLKRVR